jgi:hypothetical protein
VNFAGRNLDQLQLEMLGANQAREMRRRGKVYSRKATGIVVAAAVALALLLALAGILLLTAAPKKYVYYHGKLYLDHDYQTTYTNLVNLGGTEAGEIVYHGKNYKELSADFETNCQDYAGGAVYALPEDYAIIVRTLDWEFYQLTQVP